MSGRSARPECHSARTAQGLARRPRARLANSARRRLSCTSDPARRAEKRKEAFSAKNAPPRSRPIRRTRVSARLPRPRRAGKFRAQKPFVHVRSRQAG
jgi:hypothetical protein